MKEIQLIIDNQEIDCKIIRFSDGAITLKLDIEGVAPKRFVAFTVNPNVSVSDMEVLIRQFNDICSDQTHWNFFVRFILNLPYFPYGRADRAFEKGMSNIRENFIELLCGWFDEVITEDLHSEDDFVTSIPKYQVIMDNLPYILKDDLTICFPDKGATKDEHDFKHFALVVCEKVRDVTTGFITDYKIVSGDPKGKHILIVDDICDGGKTFEICAKSLLDKGAKSVNLYVTHGIFSKGLQPFKGIISKIYCKNIVGKYVSREDINQYNGG